MFRHVIFQDHDAVVGFTGILFYDPNDVSPVSVEIFWNHRITDLNEPLIVSEISVSVRAKLSFLNPFCVQVAKSSVDDRNYHRLLMAHSRRSGRACYGVYKDE